jgi:hypothetical protein
VTEPTPPFPMPAHLALLADVRDLKVFSDGDDMPWRNRGNEIPERVTHGIRELERAGWVCRPEDTYGWRLTQRGLDTLEAHRG